VGSRTRIAVFVVVVGAVLGLTIVPSLATEDISTYPQKPPYTNGPTDPRVLIIGDSISATKEQQDNYAFVNASRSRVGTEVRASGGYNVRTQEKFLSFAWAQTRPEIKAVFVELGTNDMNGVTTADQRSAVWRAIEDAVRTMANKCVVWLGLNASQPTLYYPPAEAKNFNQFVWKLGKEGGGPYKNLHLSSYDRLVRTNVDVQNALKADPYGAHFDGPSAPRARTALARLEQTDEAHFCL
jgi:hypothetical protein